VSYLELIDEHSYGIELIRLVLTVSHTKCCRWCCKVIVIVVQVNAASNGPVCVVVAPPET
jgi:hypothetical protein